MYGVTSEFSVLFHWSVFLFLCQYHTVFMTRALSYSLQSRSVMSPALFFLLKVALAIWGFLWFHTNFRIVLFLWEMHGILIGIALNLWRRQWHPTPVLLPGKSHGWRSLEGCSPWSRWGSDTTEQLHFHFPLSSIGEGNGNPLQCSCLENPRDGGFPAWWAAVYGVAQSRTWLKWFSSSSSSIESIDYLV